MSKRHKPTAKHSPQETSSVRSKTAQYQINVVKRINMGYLPLFLQMAHRALEKGQPVPVSTQGGESTFNVPKDILRLTVTDAKLLENIESVQFTYGTKP
jgi:hypothetical protein